MTSWEVGRYVASLQVRINAEYKARYPALTPPTVMCQWRKKYVFVFTRGDQDIVHSWIDQTTGDILKGSWKKVESKIPRGNIWAPDCGMSGVSIHGANYLR